MFMINPYFTQQEDPEVNTAPVCHFPHYTNRVRSHTQQRGDVTEGRCALINVSVIIST